MPNEHTPWSRSRHRAGLSTEQFGSLDPRIIPATVDRPVQDRSVVAGTVESRLLGFAAQPSSGRNATRTHDAASVADEPSVGPSAPGRGGAEMDPSPRSHPVSTESECDPEGDDSEAAPAAEGVEPARHEDDPAKPVASDSPLPRAVPDSPQRAVYPPYPLFSLPEAARPSGRSEPEAGSSADTARSGPGGEEPELLPAGGYALLGLCMAMAALLAVGFFQLGRTSGPNAAAAPTAATAVSTMTPHGTESREIGAGFAWGKVATNDGSTLTVTSEINKSDIVVYTDEHTKIYVVVATTVEAIAQGAPVMVYGRKHADGSISADTIAGVSLRALGSQ